MTRMVTKIIDLHCDTIGRCAEEGLDLTSRLLHFSLKARPESLRICQAAAIFIDSSLTGQDAQARFLKGYEVFCREMNAQSQTVSPIRKLEDISRKLDEKPVLLFLTVEGGTVLGGEIAWVDKLSEMGVKMLTLTWNGESELCGGVDSEKGFTPFGRQAVARMEALGMIVDASHLNDKSFWELCEFAEEPFCASHSNARAVCSHPRNLTDDQFREIVRRGGVVGLNYYRHFITEGGQTDSIDDLLRHLHHFLELGGEDAVALGSDLDGHPLIAPYLNGVEKIPALIDALERSGIGKNVVEKVLFHNAACFLEKRS